MRSSLKNNIIVRFLRKLFRDREVITKDQKTRLTRPTLVEVCKKVAEEEMKEDKLKSSLKHKIEALAKDLDTLDV
ncbi:hypothetical protein BTO06_10005 [Tenacibaculum sp. SZ-18]|uniref:hypothetical protein n=1 Tax=Tenacibaculum sp. SZ-18 TaxID=754423 RepID=UPI000C2D55F0|nr:hypothetical protein [Tenacibaculum sp. SZ-18]AUC15454.1 hypothetical protein BTO06_10005 [Tenacibaculum sp. SZ-18]